MSQSKLRLADILSVLIVVLANVTSLGGLLIPNLYRNKSFVTPLWDGNDLVTLVVTVPMLVTALIFSKRGARRAQAGVPEAKEEDE